MGAGSEVPASHVAEARDQVADRRAEIVVVRALARGEGGSGATGE